MIYEKFVQECNNVALNYHGTARIWEYFTVRTFIFILVFFDRVFGNKLSRPDIYLSKLELKATTKYSGDKIETGDFT